MLETYSERLESIEQEINEQDYVKAISECGKMVEHIVSDTFRTFHTFLPTPEDRQKFLGFEQKSWEHYSKFIQRPTIGASIRFYAPMAKGIFADHPRMDGDVIKPLGQVNEWRNKVSHTGATPPTLDDADDVFTDTETIIQRMGLKNETHDDIGIPFSIYLILTSIEQKGVTAQIEGDFRQIIKDGRKLLPSLVNLCLEREYALLDLESKQLIVEQYLTNGGSELDLEKGVTLLKEIQFFDRAEEDLESQLARVLGDSGGRFSRRAIRPYTTLLTGFKEHLRRSGADIILNFADKIKVRYLNENQIDENERVELNALGKEQGIPSTAMRRLEDRVVEAIEADIVTFQTFHSSSEDSEDNSAEIETELIAMIADGTPLTAIKRMAQNDGYTGDVEVLFEQHAPQAAEPKTELQPEIDQASIETQLINLIKLGTPLAGVQSIAQSQAYIGDIEALFAEYNPNQLEEEPTEPEVDQTAIETQLVELIKLGTPLAAIQSMAQSLGYSGDVGALFEQHDPNQVEETKEEAVEDSVGKKNLLVQKLKLSNRHKRK